jgi:hypothetical protein
MLALNTATADVTSLTLHQCAGTCAANHRCHILSRQPSLECNRQQPKPHQQHRHGAAVLQTAARSSASWCLITQQYQQQQLGCGGMHQACRTQCRRYWDPHHILQRRLTTASRSAECAAHLMQCSRRRRQLSTNPCVELHSAEPGRCWAASQPAAISSASSSRRG